MEMVLDDHCARPRLLPATLGQETSEPGAENEYGNCVFVD